MTKDISFPVNCNLQGKRLEVTARNIKIDRTQFGVVYASKGLVSTIGNKAIDDEFTIGLSLVLTRE